MSNQNPKILSADFLEAASGCFEAQKTFDWRVETRGGDLFLSLVHDGHVRTWKLKGGQYDLTQENFTATWKGYSPLNVPDPENFSQFSKDDLMRHMIRLIMRNNDLDREVRRLRAEGVKENETGAATASPSDDDDRLRCRQCLDYYEPQGKDDGFCSDPCMHKYDEEIGDDGDLDDDDL